MTYAWVAPSGVLVQSSLPQVQAKWQDKPAINHLAWSWTSWVTFILADFGHTAPRAYFAKHGWWGMPKIKMEA